MPVYGYKCENCDHYVEKMQKFSDDPLTDCPQCDGTLVKQFFPAGLIYKADGFYTTEHGHASKDFQKNTETASTCDKETPCCASENKDSACSACPASKPDKKDS